MPQMSPPPPALRAETARWVVSAPGRVNLIGEHVDYCDGLVLPAVIGLRTWIAAAPRSDETIVVETEAGRRAGITPQPGAEKWANYLRGVLAGFLKTGARPPGMDVRIASTLPQGAGLASSAALCVAFASLLETASGIMLDPDAKAQICQDAEVFAGVPSGCMDQLAAVHGRPDHALLIDCRSREVAHLPLGGAALLIIDTGVKHDLADGKYAERRAETEQAARLLGVPSLRDATREILEAARLPEPLHRRARHVISEIERTQHCAEALRDADYVRAGRLMNASHDSLRDDFAVSCPELDVLAEFAQTRAGIHGCRMTGGGFGGCCVALTHPHRTEDLRAELQSWLRATLGEKAAVLPVPLTS